MRRRYAHISRLCPRCWYGDGIRKFGFIYKGRVLNIGWTWAFISTSLAIDN